jgi:putative transposase
MGSSLLLTHISVSCYGSDMSRPLRLQYPDAWYLVMNRGRRGEAIFRDPEDYLRFVELLQQGSTMWTVRVAGFCLMPNDYHLLVQTPRANLSRFMRHLDGVYTQRFNRSHNCDGSLFRGRYKAILVEADTYLLELLRYIHRNPLRADLVSRLDRYAWSSHKGYLSRSRKWSWLHTESALSRLSEDKEKQTAAYRKFMTEAESDELTDLFSRKNLPSLMGSDGFIDWVKVKFRKLKGHQEVPDRRLLAPGLNAIKSAVCAEYRIGRRRLLSSSRGVNNQARNVAIYLSRRLSGETLATIGKAFGLNKYSSVSSVVSRMKSEIQVDTKLRKRVDKIARHLQMSQEQT